jgi:hypothetical protein
MGTYIKKIAVGCSAIDYVLMEMIYLSPGIPGFMNRILQFMICLTAVALLVMPSGTHAQSSGSLTDSQMNQLAEKFAPYLHLHPDEAFYPVSIDYAISRSTLANINTGIVTENPTVSQLSAYTDPNAGYYLDNRMGTIDDNGIREDFLENGQGYAPTAYARVTEQTYNGQSVYAVQYFFYYAFNNGPLNTHEGDWEMILVVCDLSETPIFAAYSQHLNGGFVGWDLVKSTDDHPNVFVALGSHANYFRSYEGRVGPANDICSGSGRMIAPEDFDLVMLGGAQQASQGWLNFAGTWGDYGDATSGAAGERGPVGPAYQAERWDSPISWAEGVTEADKNWFSLNWSVANAFWMILGIMGIALLVAILKVYFRKKKQGTLGPRLTPFFYIDGANAKSIGAILAAVAMVIAIAGYFLPWYTVSVDINAGDYSTPGPVKILQMDGIHGLAFNRLEQGSGLVQVMGLPIPFAWLMAFSVLIFVIGTIGLAKSRKFGFKLFGRGIGVLVPVIMMIVMVSIIGNIIGGYTASAPSEVTEIIETVSANPVSGTATRTIGDYGTATLTWGLGSGAYAFIIAAILFFIAAILQIKANCEYFGAPQHAAPVQPQYAAPEYQYASEQQYGPGQYQPAPYQQEYQPYQPPPTPAQQVILTCPRCGGTTSAMPGTAPFQCQGCGGWMYPPA